MGYTTYFTGEFTINPPLDANQVAYLTKFSSTRRMGRHESPVEGIEDPLRLAVGLPIGTEGGYCVVEGNWGDADVINYNRAPSEQPGLWCQWVPSEDGTTIVWDEGEKFYAYVEWIEYIIEHFMERWGRKLNGVVRWDGEESDDVGAIVIVDNQVETVTLDVQELLNEYIADAMKNMGGNK